jgi:hypothetical protein
MQKILSTSSMPVLLPHSLSMLPLLPTISTTCRSHDDFAKVTKAVTPQQTVAQITSRLTALRVPKPERNAAVAFASGLIASKGSCRLRIWTVKDPGGNIDRAAEVVCASA